MEFKVDKTAANSQSVFALRELQLAFKKSIPFFPQDTEPMFASNLLEADGDIKFRILILYKHRKEGDVSIPAGIYIETNIEREDSKPEAAKNLSDKLSSQIRDHKEAKDEFQLTPFAITKIHHHLVFSLTPAQQAQES